MDEAGNHHSQQTNIRTENQTLYVLTHKWVLNNDNTWAHRGEHHTPGPVGSVGGEGKDSKEWEDWGGIALGEISNVDDGVMDAANHLGRCIPM